MKMTLGAFLILATGTAAIIGVAIGWSERGRIELTYGHTEPVTYSTSSVLYNDNGTMKFTAVCYADGLTWKPRPGGMCFMADKPKP